MSLSPAEMALEKMHGANMLWVVGVGCALEDQTGMETNCRYREKTQVSILPVEKASLDLEICMFLCSWTRQGLQIWEFEGNIFIFQMVFVCLCSWFDLQVHTCNEGNYASRGSQKDAAQGSSPPWGFITWVSCDWHNSLSRFASTGWSRTWAWWAASSISQVGVDQISSKIFVFQFWSKRKKGVLWRRRRRRRISGSSGAADLEHNLISATQICVTNLVLQCSWWRIWISFLGCLISSVSKPNSKTGEIHWFSSSHMYGSAASMGICLSRPPPICKFVSFLNPVLLLMLISDCRIWISGTWNLSSSGTSCPKMIHFLLPLNWVWSHWKTFFRWVCCGSFDFMPPQSLQQWRLKMKKSHIKDKKKQVINDRQAALEKDVRAVMYIIGFRRLSGDQ